MSVIGSAVWNRFHHFCVPFNMSVIGFAVWDRFRHFYTCQHVYRYRIGSAHLVCLSSVSRVLYNCLSWYKFVNTHLYHSRQLYNIQIQLSSDDSPNSSRNAYTQIQNPTTYVVRLHDLTLIVKINVVVHSRLSTECDLNMLFSVKK